MRAALLLALLATPALADSHAVIVRNGTSEIVRDIRMGPVGGAVGENRMRSQLPPGAEARISYSTACRADLRLVFAGGRTEDHHDIDVCGDTRVVAGQEGVAGPAQPAHATGSTGRPATPVAAITQPPPPVPPWTGHSITKRFGGMD